MQEETLEMLLCEQSFLQLVTKLHVLSHRNIILFQLWIKKQAVPKGLF